MTDPIYKKIELTGSSSLSIEDAINKAIEKAGQTMRQMRWFEVTEIRGTVDEEATGQWIVDQWQVSLKVGFRLEE
jgi:flavin-binding protein dodecin